jgi:hypothetical protein
MREGKGKKGRKGMKEKNEVLSGYCMAWARNDINISVEGKPIWQD